MTPSEWEKARSVPSGSDEPDLGAPAVRRVGPGWGAAPQPHAATMRSYHGGMQDPNGLRAGGVAALLAASLAASLALGCGGDREVGGETRAPERPAAAAEAVAELRQGLGRALRAALTRGPEEAIDVCRSEVPRLAQFVARDGLTVGRTSHRLRNPGNAPEAWMQPLLEEFLKAPPEPGGFRVVDLGARGTGYVEPIYLQPLCATCHGETVDPALLAHIRERYPQDRAVGFRIGELRGLFWAVVAPRPDGTRSAEEAGESR